jgi:tetratricopeptide (TPR) repeat protein
MAKKRVSKTANPRRSPATDNIPTAIATEERNESRSTRPLGLIRFSDAAGFSAIFLATLAAYLPALNGGLLWDDTGHVTRPDLQSLHGLWRIWFDIGATQQYYPLLHSAFWIEHQLWGNAVIGYHLTNVALHALSACLVVLIVRRLGLSGAWLAGFVFVLHPVFVEGVAWISEQKSTLSGVFCLAALLIYLQFDESRRKSKYLLATGLFVLALLSKTVTATLPAALLVIVWWRRGRLTRRDVQPLIPWLALGAFAGLFTAWAERTLIGANGAAFALSPLQRVLLAGRAICFYAGKLLWPVNLTFSYPHWKIDPAVWWQYLFLAGVLALGIGLALWARHRRGPLAGFLLFAGTLFPVLGFLNVYPFRYSYVADHFQYLASLGIIVPVAAALVTAAERISPGKTVAIALSAGLLLVLGTLTWRQSRDYRDMETLYRATLARNPESWLAHNNLGGMLSQRPGGLQAAMAEYEAALRLEPDYPETHNNRGIALLKMRGRRQEAIAELETALRIKPDYVEAHNSLGIALAQIPGRQQDAIAEFRAAARIRPGYAEAHNNLGGMLARLAEGEAGGGEAGGGEAGGGLQDAVAEYRAALRSDPNYAEAHYNLGFLLAQMPRQLPEAIAEYRAALRLKPDYAEAHNNLGSALARTAGRERDAIAEFAAAIRLRPNYAEAHNNLGSALAHTPGRLQDAIAEYQTALRLQPTMVEAHNNLGNALAQMPGRNLEAIAEFRAALRLKPDLAQLHYNLGVVLAQTPGRLPDAIAEYREALRIKPDYADAHFNLGSALAHVPGHLREALGEFQAVLAISPDSQAARQSMEQVRAALK